MTHTTQTYKFALWTTPKHFDIFLTYEDAWKAGEQFFEVTGKVACIEQIRRAA